MTDIRTQWPEVARRLRTTESLLILTDFEGALVNLDDESEAPALATLSRGVLQSLTTLRGLTLAVHGTGSIRSLVSRSGMENIWYVGSGGLDIRDPEGGETRFYGPDDVRIMAAFRDQLALRTSRMEGTRVDLSGPTLTLHYRRVSPADIPIVLEAFRSVAQLAGPMVMTLHSPGVIEARVRSARDERSAVRFIRRHLKPGTLIFYFGRNSRVQEALRDLHPSAMVVEAGITTSSPSGYSVPDSSALFEVLTRLAGEWSKCRTERPASEGPAGSDS